MQHLCLFTIGHSNQTLAEFVDLLRRYGISVLADVRSHPHSRYVPHFDREVLAASLADYGIKYVFMGSELGGRPTGDEFYDPDGYALYYRIAESPVFVRGIERLEAGIRRYRVAIMCSEEDPKGCHRHLLIARVLDKRGTVVQHIRADGSLAAYSTLKDGEYQQQSLFELWEDTEDTSWKSTRWVLRRRAQPSSSDSSEAPASDDWSTSD